MSIVEDIIRLKEEKNAVILAHYYVDEEVQDIADYIGDSFYLSKVATKTDADRIIFCGVEFMGESAKDLKSGQACFYAGCDSRLSDGTYGDRGGNRKGQRPV